ncbi:MAG: hypothetical protein FJ148_27080 [Deltaproteobacteria bacterium]|nr:hypothetical protein [Deltaproteobacteria bacterium]
MDVAACSQWGVWARKGVTAESSSATGCDQSGFDSSIGPFRGTDTVANGNGHAGVDGRSVSVRNLTAQGNTVIGVITVRNMSLSDSVVTGNGLGSGGLDVASQEGRIRLRNTVCDHSGGLGLCSID